MSPFRRHLVPGLLLMVHLAATGSVLPANDPGPPQRLRILIETDAGGDPDDEQSMVRFLLYANEWDLEGIIANRVRARDGENLNPERTGIGVVRRLVDAYGACWPRLAAHDPRYPHPDRVRAVTVAGHDQTDDGVARIIAAVDSPDPRPLWYSDWGTDHGSGTNNLRRALDRVLHERGPEGYARFKRRLRLASADKFGPHTTEIDPPFPIWVDTWRPELDGRRWYHQFSRIVGRAGGFDLARDCLTGHGPLGAMYPTNTGPAQKEGDSLSFVYLIPTGLGDPMRPDWGGWGGRLGRRTDLGDRPYHWADQADAWEGRLHRDRTLERWAVAIQNDFRARLDWCVTEPGEANHPPVVQPAGITHLTARPGTPLTLTVAGSSDPDGQPLRFRWEIYPEAGTLDGPVPLQGDRTSTVSLIPPDVDTPATLHVIAAVSDDGEPSLTRYARFVIRVDPVAPGPVHPLPSGPGLAAGYPGDRGLEDDPSVLLFEDFETGGRSGIDARWEGVSDAGGQVLALVPDAPPGSRGRSALQFTAHLGVDTGGHLYRRLPREVDRAFARFYVHFAPGSGYTHHFFHLGGYNPATAWPQGGAGERPRGDERFTVGVEPFGENGRHPPPGAWFLYTYWHEMKASAGGRYWGNGLRPATPQRIPTGRWQCVEVMVKLNSRPEVPDGELALWVEGRLAAHFAAGARRGPWTGMGFQLDPDGPETVEGFRFRNSPDLRLNFLWLLDYITEQGPRQNGVANPPRIHQVSFDHVVVAERYIGPIAR